MTFDEFLEALRQPPAAEPCPVGRTLDILRGKWSARIIFELQKRPCMRFGELRERIGGITNTMLSTTLKELEGQGLVQRTQYNEIPPRVEYALTESGRDMLPIFFEIANWAEKHLD